jgi:hypothetical protein
MPEVNPNGFELVDNVTVPPRYRTSKYREVIEKLQPGQALKHSDEKAVSNLAIAARAWAKRLTAEGKDAPKFITRKLSDSYALIRES